MYNLQSKQDSYATIFAIAMDYLPIQVSSIPCKHVFSSSIETDTKKHNQISPMLMEVLQILKYNFRKCQLMFASTKLDQHELLEDKPEFLAGMMPLLSLDDAVDTIIGHTIARKKTKYHLILYSFDYCYLSFCTLNFYTYIL